VTEAHAGAVPADAAALVHCDNPHVVLSALTASANAPTGSGTFVARWYNSSAAEQAAEITSPPAIRARAVDFLEAPTRARVRRVGPQRWRVHFRPFEIVTLQIRTR